MRQEYNKDDMENERRGGFGIYLIVHTSEEMHQRMNHDVKIVNVNNVRCLLSFPSGVEKDSVASQC